MKRLWFLPLIFVAVLGSFTGDACAHMEHTLLTYYATFEQLYGKKVVVEPLEQFAYMEREKIAAAIRLSDDWCTKQFDNYRPVPSQLIANMERTSSMRAKDNFFNAIRVNHKYFGGWYIQKISTDYDVNAQAQMTRLADYSNNYYGYHVDLPFFRVEPGSETDALDVLCTATEIPDCGIDGGLWEDSNSEYSARYGMGRMPFGEARESGQRAPFHAPMYYNPYLAVVYPSAKAPYAFYRIKTFREIAKVAFATGHPYWGYHFAGLALHYVEDCTFPYHVKMLPGHTDLEVTFAALAEFSGTGKQLHDIINMTLAEHFLLEFYICSRLIADWNNDGIGRFSLSCANLSYDLQQKYSDRMPLDILARSAAEEAEAYHLLLENMTDVKYTQKVLDDRVARFDKKFDDIWDTNDKVSMNKLDTVCCKLLGQTGAAARNFMQGMAPVR